jgi:hypothetical protein
MVEPGKNPVRAEVAISAGKANGWVKSASTGSTERRACSRRSSSALISICDEMSTGT